MITALSTEDMSARHSIVGVGLGWPEVESTHVPVVEVQLGEEPSFFQPRLRSQMVLEIARLLSGYWLPKDVRSGMTLFETEVAGTSLLTTVATHSARAMRAAPFYAQAAITNEAVWGWSVKDSTVVTYFNAWPRWNSNLNRVLIPYVSQYAKRLGASGAVVLPTRLERHTAVHEAIPGSSAPPVQWTNQSVAAMQEIKSWLNLTTDEAARLVGTSKGAVYYWQRVGAEPRTHVARRIARVHSLLRALRNSTTDAGFQAILRARPAGFDRSAFDLLLNQDFDTAERLLHDFVFSGPRTLGSGFGRVADWPDPGPALARREGVALKTPRTKRQRVRLRKRD